MENSLNQQILDLLLPLIKRFPSFPTANALYNRNFVTVFRAALKKNLSFPEATHHLSHRQLQQFHIHFTENTTGSYDLTKLETLNKLFNDELKILKEILRYSRSLEQDLNDLKKHSVRFDYHAKKLIHISPFLYDSAGKSRQKGIFNQALFSNYSPSQIQNLYDDHFRYHLVPVLEKIAKRAGFGQLQKIINNTLNQFIPKQISRATQLYNHQQQTLASRNLVLEEVPPLYSALRGAVAKDCSMVSVPFYGLLKSVRVFWLFKSKQTHETPEGYVLWLEQVINGKVIPCILTVNGPNLTQADVHATFKAVSELYETPKIIVADWSQCKFLVNYLAIREALAQCKIVECSDFTLPNLWQEMSDKSFDFDCYEEKHLSHFVWLDVGLMPLKSLTFSKQIVDNQYPQVQQLAEITNLDRGIVAHYFYQEFLLESNKLSGSEINLDADQQLAWLEEHLDINKNQLKSIHHFFELYLNKTFTSETYWILNREFDFGLLDLLSIDVLLRAPVLIELIKSDCFGVDEEKHLKRICLLTFDQLREKLKDTTLNPETHSYIKDQLTAMPDQYVDTYWSVVREFLFHPESQLPDYYALQRMVKHLKSKNAIASMLEFFLENPVFLTFIRAQDKRWFEIFLKAESVNVEQSVLSKIYYECFYKKLLDKNSNLAIYETAKITVYGHCLGLLDKLNLSDVTSEVDIKLVDGSKITIPKNWLDTVANAQGYVDSVYDEFIGRVSQELERVNNA